VSTTAGTIEQLASELARVFSPLAQRLQDGSPATILASLGLRVPDSLGVAPVNTAVQAACTAAGAIHGLIDQLTAAISANDADQVAGAAKSLLDEIARTVQAAAAVATELQKLTGAGLTPAQVAELTTFAGEFVSRLLNQLLVEYFQSRAPQLAILLIATGGIEIVEVPGGADGSLQAGHTRKTFRFDRTTKLFTDPGGTLKDTYSWGAPGFDGLVLFTVLQKLMQDQFNLPAEILQPPGLPAALEAFGFHLAVDNTVTPPGLDLDVRVPAQLSQDDTINADDWDVTFKAEVDLAADFQAKLRPPFDIEIDLPSGSLDAAFSAGLARNNTAGPLFLFGSPAGSFLQVQTPGGTFSLNAHFNTSANRLTLAPSLELALKGGKLAISSDGADSFIGTLLSGAKLQSSFDAQLTWNLQQGVSFVGSAALEIGIPTHVTLGPLEITQLFLRLTTPSDGSIPIELSTAFSATLGPIEASVDRMGLAALFRFPQGGGNLGPADLTLAFKPPNGVGLSIDAGVVQGGGYLFFDADQGEYAGAIELQVFDTVTVKAIGIISTKMPDGSKGFSLLIIMSVEFATGIQLGFGFTLLAVGGLLGLNRTINLQALTDAIRSGAIESLMFPRDIIANAPKIISDLKAFFPPRTGIFLIGPMAKLGWGTPTLITLSLAVIIEIPGNIAIAGIVQVALPRADEPLIELNVAFTGAIEFDKQRIWFFASLFDSRILFQSIEGEMGLLMAYGDDSNFVVSVGGFHPRFDPPPLPFPTPRRVAMSLVNTSAARVRVDSYYAITSNTAQFGSRADVFFGVSDFNVQGNVAFDALFQFSPFYFVIDLSASLSVKVFGVGLFSVHLHGTIEGPAPWHIEGHGSISLLFFDIGVDFSVTWGDDRKQELPPIPVLPLIQNELNKSDNWRAFLPQSASLFVSLRKIQPDEAPLILHPVGVLRISQRALPLDLHLDKIGSQKPADVNRVSLSVTGGLQKNADTLEPFAPAQYQDFSDADKLSQPAFSPEHSGLDLGPTDDLRSSKMVRRVVRYEEIILDSNAKRFASGFKPYFGVLFNFFLNGAAIARCEVSNARKLQLSPFADKIAVQSETFTVAFQADNTPFSADSAEFHSEASARDFLNRQIADDPSLTDQIHVIPSVERAA
jgi:hypothetical protein